MRRPPGFLVSCLAAAALAVPVTITRRTVTTATPPRAILVPAGGQAIHTSVGPADLIRAWMS